MWKNKLSFLYSVRKFDVFFNRPGIIKIGALLRNLAVFFMCYIITSSTFCYPLFFIFRKIFMAFSMILTLFSFSSLEKCWYLSQVFFCVLFFFFFWKTLIPFTCLVLIPFFVFQIISSWHFYICGKDIWLIFYTLKST